MPLRMAITKSSGQGEQLVIDICQWNPVTGAIVHEDMDEMFCLQNQALQMADIRVQEMNLRHLESYRLKQWCSLEVWQKIGDILDILAGRVDAETVARRWQSAIEETQELEKQRLFGLDPEDASFLYYLNQRKEQIAALGCTCDHDERHNCPIHSYGNTGI